MDCTFEVTKLEERKEGSVRRRVRRDRNIGNGWTPGDIAALVTRSLLLQLFEQLPALQSVFDCLGPTTGNSGCSEWSIESLKALFDEAVRGLGKSSLVCF
jgi:hypothetical protein